MDKIALEMKDISKNFHGVYALKDVSFCVKEGEIHSIVGENGAGKSTLMNVLTGVYKPEEGTMTAFGEPYIPKNPLDAQNKGIAMIHQELSVVTNLTVSENIFLGRYIRNKLGFVDYKSMNDKTEHVLKSLKIEGIKPTDKVVKLSISERQMIEIAKAISTNSKVIIMDEPTSSLTLTETDNLLKMMKKLSEAGITIIFISHRMDEVFSISDTITVMRDSRYIATLAKEEATPNKVISLMVGRDLGDIEYVPRKIEGAEKILEVKKLKTDKLDDVEFDLYKGEILGFAGLVGSGRTEVARAIFGLDKVSSMEITLNGRRVEIKDAKTAIQKGFGIVTEDRKQQGLFLRMSVKDNIVTGKLPKKSKIFIDGKREKMIAEEYKDKLDIRTASINLAVGNLSGGNQQKAVIARWLLTDPQILILDEPTRGVDVGSKVEIYNLIRELADRGVGVILISSELPEILRMCDRTVVMANGKITATLDREHSTQERIMEYATKSVSRREEKKVGMG